MKLIYVSIFTILLVLVSGLPLMSSPAINYASARYAPAETQTQANANECDTGTNCAINSPQTQGDGSASSPTNLQISGGGLSSGIFGPPSSDIDIIEIDRLVCDTPPPRVAWITCTGLIAGTQIPIEELICRTGGGQPLLPPFICLITISPSVFGIGIFRQSTECLIDTPLNPQVAKCVSHWGPVPPP